MFVYMMTCQVPIAFQISRVTDLTDIMNIYPTPFGKDDLLHKKYQKL